MRWSEELNFGADHRNFLKLRRYNEKVVTSVKIAIAIDFFVTERGTNLKKCFVAHR